MHVAFHFVVQPADVYSQRLGLSVLDAIRTFCDVRARIALSGMGPVDQGSRSRSFGSFEESLFWQEVIYFPRKWHYEKHAHHHCQHFQRKLLARLFWPSP
jgi:hypothetical protein